MDTLTANRMRTGMTFREWELAADDAGRAEITIIGEGVQPRIREYMRGVYDTASIETLRIWLFGLADYYVARVSGGVIWLAPGESLSARYRREQVEREHAQTEN